jgi:hypothetical protein
VLDCIGMSGPRGFRPRNEVVGKRR